MRSSKCSIAVGFGLARVLFLALVSILCVFLLCACNEKTTVDTADYNNMAFPNYTEENPVCYLQENEFGKYDGWQDFGKNGEIRTVGQPMASTYTYQMYSWYIRNDLQSLYEGYELPEDIADMPKWVSDTTQNGRRILWKSMGDKLPNEIELVATATIATEDGSKEFVKAQYEITVKGISGDDVNEQWIVYFTEDDGEYSSFAVEVNEDLETVERLADSIVESYKVK
ncbi:MAG: hypothetical protein E7261_02085 [Lachnospiraceae bacterium]|nr:hypothetical protein [Lachnospiraceae bacterium]